jgi:hypothetical protein
MEGNAKLCDGLNVIALLFIGSLNVQKSPRLEAVIRE